jgi:uncharacterized ubiquitin-like protein YukD
VSDFHSLKALVIKIADFNKNSESQDETNIKQAQQASIASNPQREVVIGIEKYLSNWLTKFDIHVCNISSMQKIIQIVGSCST